MTLALNDIDQHLVTRDFLRDPYPAYRQLLEEDPVHWCEPWNAWLVMPYEDNLALFRDSQNFGNANRFDTLFEHLPDDVRAEIRPLEDHFVRSGGLIHADPPDHTRLRNLVHTAFTPRVIRRMQALVESIVEKCLDTVQPSGQMDLIHDLAYPLPATVIASLLGVPEQDIDSFKRWSYEVLLFQAMGRTTPEIVRISHASMVEMKGYLRRLAAQRRAEPQDDLMTELVRAEDQGDKLREEELLSTCVTFMVAGHETTTNLIGNGILTLLEHPEQAQRLRENPALMPAAVEEMLRYESPIQRNRRVIRRDLEYKGKRMKKGEILFQMLGAANRDPAVFADPDTFDMTRQPNPHIAFGYGIHFCLGAPLARLEAPIALNALLQRMPDLRLTTDDLEWVPNIMRGAKNIPLAF